MNRYTVRVITKTETPSTVEADTPEGAIERVLAGFGDKSDEDYPEPDIFVKPLES